MTNTKRALLVGVNEYANPLYNLNGCCNDVEDVRSTILPYGFETPHILTLTNSAATSDTVLKAIEDLISVTRSGDDLLLYFSCHGTQVKDTDGDEADSLDECLCLYDFDFTDSKTWLIDDDLAAAIKPLVDGAFLTVIADACHSQSITRDLTASRRIINPFPLMGKLLRRFGVRKDASRSQRHICLSGCKDTETSQETTIDGQTRGVMTYALCRCLTEDEPPDWYDVMFGLTTRSRQINQNQEPQISGARRLLRRPPFGGRP